MQKRFATTEWCDECEQETTFRNLKEGTHRGICKHCGKELLLCTECMGRIGDCEPNNKQAFCYKED